MNDNQNKIALVTGASRGIGQAIAHALGKTGATVLGTATTVEGAEKISKSFADAGINGLGIMMNVNDQTSVDAAFAIIKEKYSAPLILVNNAAITSDNLMLRMKDEEWNNVINTNLNSLFKITRACLRDMVKARWGRVINIGSVVGSTGNAGQVNYSTAKAGLLGFTKSLSLEVGSRNITVNAIAPGFIETDMTRELSEDQRAQLIEHIPLQRVSKPEEIAETVVFLASDSASYITGQTLHVNGGMFMD